MINCNHNTIHDMLCTKLYYILITRFYLFKMQVVGNVYMYVIWEDHKEHALISYNGADDTSSILDVHEAPPLPSWMSMLHLPLASRRSMQLIPLLSRRSMHPCLFPLWRSRSWIIALNKCRSRQIAFKSDATSTASSSCCRCSHNSIWKVFTCYRMSV